MVKQKGGTISVPTPVSSPGSPDRLSWQLPFSIAGRNGFIDQSLFIRLFQEIVNIRPQNIIIFHDIIKLNKIAIDLAGSMALGVNLRLKLLIKPLPHIVSCFNNTAETAHVADRRYPAFAPFQR